MGKSLEWGHRIRHGAHLQEGLSLVWGADREIPHDNRTWELRRQGGAKCTGISTRVVELPLTVTKQWLSKWALAGESWRRR